MTSARPRLPANEVERLAKRLRDLYLHKYGTLTVHESFDRIAAFVLRHYVPRKRPAAKAGKGKR